MSADGAMEDLNTVQKEEPDALHMIRYSKCRESTFHLKHARRQNCRFSKKLEM
jgi:hypothetical protein